MSSRVYIRGQAVHCALGDDMGENHAIARRIGYPVIIKAAAGGGGRGMRVVHTEAHLSNALQLTQQEAVAAFGDKLGCLVIGSFCHADSAHLFTYFVFLLGKAYQPGCLK